ncbi:MAG: hypothetical protein U5J96_05525 [Ignavibacteriaceae bacterium]|nr:hypothetical protein [Ignavibacteriaceae bacterium]
MKKFLIIYFLFTLMVGAQQTGNIAGNVTDATTGEGLPGVNIILKGTCSELPQILTEILTSPDISGWDI